MGRIGTNFLSSLTPSPLSNFLKLYFDYLFYLCLSPFQFIRDSAQPGHFSVRTWLPQKVICGLCHLFSLLVLVRDLQSKVLQPASSFHKNPVKYFTLIDSIFNFIYKATLIKRLWWNQKEFVNLMSFITSTPCFQSQGHSKLAKPIYIHGVLLFYGFVGTASLIAGKNFVSGLAEWTPDWWGRRLVVLSRYTFYIDWKMGKGAPQIGEISGWEIGLAGITALGLLSRFILGFYIDLSILAMTTTLWTATLEFSKVIRFSPFEKWVGGHQRQSGNFTRTVKVVEVFKGRGISSHKKRIGTGNGHWDDGDTQLSGFSANFGGSTVVSGWAAIYDHFDAIRILSTLINKALGSLVIWFVLEALMYYAVNMDAFLITKDLFKKFYLLAYYLGTVVIFSFSSNVCKEVCLNEKV